MKAKITNAEAKDLNCFAFGYCEIQNLLHLEDPIYYTCGIYGRKADFYRIEDPKTQDVIWIST